MNDPDFAHTIKRSLGRIIENAPAPAPWPVRYEPERVGTALPRWIVPATAAAVGVAGASIIVVTGGRGADAPGSVAPGTSVSTSAADASTNPGVAVTGEPICGDALPVTVFVPGAAGEVPGPVLDPAPAAGQYVAHWEGEWGTVEVRWPADDRILYDLSGEHADTDIGPDYIEHGVGSRPDSGDGLEARLVTASVWDGTAVTAEPTDALLARLALGPGNADSAPPCDVLQVRYVGTDGWHALRGYFWPDLAGISEVDLQPLIVASDETASPPAPDAVTPCDPERGVRGGTSLGNDVAATPAAALLAFVTEPLQEQFPESGFREHAGEDVYTYTYFPPDDPEGVIATLITVERVGDGWTVTGLYHSGC